MSLSISSIFKNNGKWLEQQQTTVLSAATIIAVANVVSMFAGFLRERLLIATFFHTGTSQQAYEAFKVAFQIPNTLFQIIILGALSATLVPLFTQHKKEDEARAFAMSSIIFNYIILAFVIISAVIFIFAEPITRMRTGAGFTPEQVQIVINLTRIMLLSQLFFAISNFLTGILQSYQRFILPAFSPILYNLGILIGVYVFSPFFGIYSTGIGVVIGAFLHMAVQLPMVLKLGFRYRWSFDLDFPGVKRFIKLSPPRTVALTIGEFKKLALGFFATSLGNLSFLVMDYGLALMTVPIRFVGVPIGQASLPFLSDEASEQDLKRFKELLLQSLHQIAFLCYPASILLLILRIPIVRLVYGAAQFPWQMTKSTGMVLAIVSFSIVGQSLVHLLIRAFYALKDTKTPLIVTCLDALIYLMLCWIFVFKTKYGVYGIALTTTITGLLEFLTLLLLLDRKIHGIAQKSFWIPQFKMIITSFFMAVFLYLPFKILDELVFDTSRTIELIALTITTSTMGLLVYMYFSALFDVRELHFFLQMFSKFGGWRQSLRETKEMVVETPVEGDEL
jgi:putative peptidoglycan lipid II flippase